MNGKTFTVVYYRQGKFFWKKEWFATNKYGGPDLPKFYYFFLYPQKREDIFTCYCYTDTWIGDQLSGVNILGIMYPLDYDNCIQRDQLDYYNGFKKPVAELIKPYE